MKTHFFLSKLNHDAIVAAIRDAEKNTSGEIRVYISHRKIEDAFARAQMRFAKLEMHNTQHRNAVLIYLAPRSRKFAIVGDSGIHEKCGDVFWNEISAQLSRDLQNEAPTRALVKAIQKVGEVLARHFPPSGENRNELPNAIEGD